MTDLNVDELYADVIASASPTGYIQKTLRALVEKLKVDDVFVPHDVSLSVLRSDRTALLHVEPDEGWAALLTRAQPDERWKESPFPWPYAGVCRIGPYRIVFSITADIDDVAAEFGLSGRTVVPIVAGWATHANVVPVDNHDFYGGAFRHAVTRCPLLGA
ncbi:hypothetical protein WJ05_27855 [Burkholderia vietnamiensis]|uniref:hypothetical protein n=1 Tax=Burkholderia vietnamiensis TaxID=60552 RepID=UPI000752E00B|nr:hypothetical protein [Burkholderia vietnamiensis]KVF05614.1 hypothetical protein WJ05_27855 [Burkholderia vietnamiensis]